MGKGTSSTRADMDVFSATALAAEARVWFKICGTGERHDKKTQASYAATFLRSIYYHYRFLQ